MSCQITKLVHRCIGNCFGTLLQYISRDMLILHTSNSWNLFTHITFYNTYWRALNSIDKHISSLIQVQYIRIYASVDVHNFASWYRTSAYIYILHHIRRMTFSSQDIFVARHFRRKIKKKKPQILTWLILVISQAFIMPNRGTFIMVEFRKKFSIKSDLAQKSHLSSPTPPH